jgi:hypothetical protein
LAPSLANRLPRNPAGNVLRRTGTAHGQQQLTFCLGPYNQNRYLPLVITCADNEQFVMLALRPGNAHATLGADDDLVYLVSRLCRV